MADTYSRIIIHATFSTRFRRPYLDQVPEHEVYSYLGGVVNSMGGQSITVNGYRDHVHMLFHCPPRLAISKLVQEAKKNSTDWVQEKFVMPKFRWQEGFAAFSVDYRDLEGIIAYIKNQRQHHEQKTFRKEYEEALKDYGFDFDEHYAIEPEEV